MAEAATARLSDEEIAARYFQRLANDPDIPITKTCEGPLCEGDERPAWEFSRSVDSNDTDKLRPYCDRCLEELANDTVRPADWQERHRQMAEADFDYNDQEMERLRKRAVYYTRRARELGTETTFSWRDVAIAESELATTCGCGNDKHVCLRVLTEFDNGTWKAVLGRWCLSCCYHSNIIALRRTRGRRATRTEN